MGTKMTGVTFEIAKDDIHEAVTLTIDHDSVTIQTDDQSKPTGDPGKISTILMSLRQFDQIMDAMDNANKLAQHYTDKAAKSKTATEAR